MATTAVTPGDFVQFCDDQTDGIVVDAFGTTVLVRCCVPGRERRWVKPDEIRIITDREPTGEWQNYQRTVRNLWSPPPAAEPELF